MNEYTLTRRTFISGAAAALPAATVLVSTVARAADLPHLSPADPAAKALLYSEDATKVDTKNPLAAKYKPGQTCATCAQIMAPTGDWRGCKIFPGKAVNAKGWCSVYAAKA